MNQNHLVKICEDALLNSKGVYKALRLSGADVVLPGLDRCEKRCEEALEAIEQYLKSCN